MASRWGGPGLEPATNADLSFIAGGGEIGELVRAMDWRRTPLGPVSEWRQSLRTSMGICLSSRFPLVLFWGPELVLLYNDAYRPFTGAKHPHSLGRPGLEVWSEIRDVIEPMLRHVMTTGEATWSEDLMLPIVRREVPEESYFTFTYSPIRDESGGVGGVFCAVVETTQRVIEERRLRLLNALAEATQARTPAQACVQAAAQLARCPSDIPFALLYLLDERSGVATLAAAANVEAGTRWSPTSIRAGDPPTWPLARAGASDSPMTLVLEDGPSGARGAVVLPIERSGGGGHFGYIVAGLSPLLCRSASYDRFHNLLSASISQAVGNAAAYEAENRRAESLAAIDRAKTAFFSNVSHEFRTPLTLILAPVQDMLGAPPGTSIDPAAVQLLHRNALRLLKLVNTLLDFSRIEAGRVEAAYEPVDLAALTAELASTFRSAFEGAGLALVVDCPPQPEPVYVDRDMWEKIVLNLLSNAFKFTFEGSITVSLRTEARGASLRIADTGIGIAGEELPRLFERFHRVEGARGRSHEGSGIGLALVQELVRLHEGEIDVTSVVGAGTTFHVRVPRGAAHLPRGKVRPARGFQSAVPAAEPYVLEALRWQPDSADTGVASEPPASADRGHASGERIVFVDDNADMRDYVGRLLGDHWDVEAFGDGIAALASIRRDPPDLVVCDVMMPGLDGYALVRTMRGDAALRAIPIVMLSARAGEEEAAKALSSGANDYVAKPFSARDLLVRVASHLAERREIARALAEVEASEARFRRLAESAERANRAKDEFLATMSHELRTPLNAVLGWATMLADDHADTAKLQRGLPVVERNARTLVRLVADLLDVSRIVSGKLRLAVKKTEVSSVVLAALDVVRQAADAKGVRLVVSLDPDTGAVLADPDRLQQTVWNLLVNAVKFTPTGGTIHLTTHRDESAVRVVVRDDGAGIPREHLPFIFDRFMQVDASMTRVHGGLGLGLAIVRHLVEAHGGSVDAASDGPGRGATFSISLPIQARNAVDEELAAGGPGDDDVSGGRSRDRQRLFGSRVLVVDDDEDSLDVIRAILEGAGATVTGTKSGRDALAAAARTRFDVVISDVGMPGMDGYAFMRRLRLQETVCPVPAIALTAYARREDAVQAFGAGFQQHVAKPVDPEALVAAVEKLLHAPEWRVAFGTASRGSA